MKTAFRLALFMGEHDPFKMLARMESSLFSWWVAYDRLEPIGVWPAQIAVMLKALEEKPENRAGILKSLLGWKS